MTEDQLLRAVLDAGALLGFRCYHARPARTARGWRTAAQGNGAAGFPDVCMVGNQRVIFAELKAANGSLSDEQADWLNALDVPGIEVWVWRPEDWLDGTIESVLRATA